MISCENDNVVNDHTDGEAAWSFSQRGDPPMRPQQRVFSHPWNVHFRYHMFFTSLYIYNYTQNILYCLCLSASPPPPPPPPPPPSSSQHFVWTTNVSPASVLSPSSQQQQSKWESDKKLELMKKVLETKKESRFRLAACPVATSSTCPASPPGSKRTMTVPSAGDNWCWQWQSH